MATLIAPVKATPYSAVYHLTGSASGEGTRVGTTLISDLVDGPLKTELLKAMAVSGCGDFNLTGSKSGRIRIYFVAGVNAVVTTPTTISLYWNATGLAATLSNSTDTYIEIRFRHSRDR